MSGTKQMNVDLSAKRTQTTAVLQKIDSNVLGIIEDASHAVVFNFENGKWEKGKWEMGNGKWEMGNWEMGNGKFEMENGK